MGPAIHQGINEPGQLKNTAMATAAVSGGEKLNLPPVPENDHTPPSNQRQELQQPTPPWIVIDSAVQQALIAQKTIQHAVDSFVSASQSRLLEIRSTSSAHLHQTIESLKDVKAEYHVYEDVFFGKIKEGILVAASNPLATSGIVVGAAFLGLKRPRRFLYNRTLRLFVSEQALMSRADAKVKELKQSLYVLGAESEKLEKAASLAEEKMMRGRTKLRQAGNQIQGVIRSANRVERQATGLIDILGEIRGGEASSFRSQVSKLASAAKREKKALTKEVSKISDHGISV